MFDALTFIRDIVGAFERNVERSNCHACNGSGVLYSQKSTKRKQTIYSDDRCWFCEGVGSMPLYGLHGFLLGSASASFRTDHPMRPPCLLQLHLSTHLGAECKVGPAVKLSRKLDDLLYNWSASPAWLLEAAEELAAAAAMEILELHDASVALIMSDMRSKGFPGVVSQISLESTELSSHDGPNLTMHSFKNVDLYTRSGLAQYFRMGQTPLAKGKQMAGGRVQSESAAESSTLRASAVLVDRSEPLGQTELDKVSREFRKRNSISRKPRSARQNHIRVKAERNARMRALWFLKLKPLNSQESSPMTSIDESVAPWEYSTGWKELSSKWIAEETALARASTQSSTTEAEGALIQVLWAKLVGTLSLAPNFGKSHP